MSCCPVTAEPPRAASPSTGSIKKFGQTTLYVTGPATAKAGIIAYPDIFGLDSGRAKADADALGKLGYAVVLVDLVDGDYLDPETFQPVLVDWFKKYPFDTYLSLRVNDAIKYLQSEAKVQRVASYGYCWARGSVRRRPRRRTPWWRRTSRSTRRGSSRTCSRAMAP
ncbi:hypothetical protein PINS_up001896 [Pythium insidiosum]|nr:hypothetical protein PINS_up001896 [Pythium insidiosum]